MIELSPYYFSSSDQHNEFTISYYPINDKWRIVITNKKKTTEYWLTRDQASSIRDVLIESISDTGNTENELST